MHITAAFTGSIGPAKLGRWLAGMVLLGVLGLLPGQAQPIPAGDLEQIRARAEKKDPEALNALGNIFTNGLLGVKQDFVEALTWYRQAAETGYAPAQFNLGLACELGRGVPADERQAFKYYLMAAEQGVSAAQFNVGNMYSAGRGVGQNLFEANLWYKQAAEKGVIEAQFALGLAYEAGRGVKKDEVQAARWYKQAADHGFARAQFNLGLLFEEGRGVPKNEVTAAGFYRAAAEQGFAGAQNSYGLMLSEGRGGLPTDRVQAYYWLSLAVANGVNPAARDFIARSLSATQLATANALLEQRKSGQPIALAPAPPVAPDNSAATDLKAIPTEALEKDRQVNQRPEPEPSRGGESGKLIEQLRDQSRRLSEQVQSLTADKDAAERSTAVLTAQVKDLQHELGQQKATASAPTKAAPAVDVAKYESQITALTAKLELATASLSQLQQANQQLTEENARLQKELEVFAAPKPGAAASTDVGKYSIPDADKDTIIANLQKDNARLNDEVKRSTLELLSLNQQIRNLRKQTAKPATP